MSTKTEVRKVRVGRVVSDKMDKTVVVAVERLVKHRLYGKMLKRVTKFNAHDQENQYHVGDIVRIVETRPLSATKRWRVSEVITTSRLPDVAPAEVASTEVQALEAEEAAEKAEVIAATEVTQSKAAEVAEAVVPEAVVEVEIVDEELEAVVESPEPEEEAAPADEAPKRKPRTKAKSTKAEAEVAIDEPAEEMETPVPEAEQAPGDETPEEEKES